MDLTAEFEAERQRLFDIAYRMLGSANEADDVVQDGWLRWQSTNHDTVRNPAAFLTTVISRLALDRLKSARRQRETYSGPWLPEPIATSAGPESATILGESVMLGFLAVLERLGPAERAVFVLRDVFGLSYPEISDIVDRSVDNCRQIAHRARIRIRADRPRVTPNLDRDRRLLDAFLYALSSGETGHLEQLFHQEVVLISDGGHHVRAARRPILGASRVARFLVGIAKNARVGNTHLEYLTINNQVAACITLDGGEMTLFIIEPTGSDDKINRVFVVRNPDKMGRLGN